MSNPSTNLPSSLPTSPEKKGGCLKPALIICLVFFLVTVGAGAAYWWWSNRPIPPVVLSTQELQVIKDKAEATQITPDDPRYEPGSKSMVFTEREINGLLHHNTQMGDKVKIELATDAIHARINVDLDEDVPFLGGKTVKAKARFIVKTELDQPAIILDDLTVWGVSLPNDWLAELKGQNLLSNVGGDITDNAFARGIKHIAIKNGQVEIELNE